MTPLKKTTAVLAAILVTILFAASDCEEGTERNEQNDKVSLDESLETKNLERKLKRENDPNAVRYIYLMSFSGNPVGYYVIKGKVSSSGSQLAPEDEYIDCGSSCGVTADSKQDDGTYGAGDPGIFFFTADDTMVSTTLDYIESDAPLPIDVPRLGGK